MKTSIISRIAIGLLHGLLLATTLYAQNGAEPLDGSGDNILEPGSAPVLVGPYGGAGVSQHNGGFVTTERGILCCQFDRGMGVGAVAGAKAIVPVGGGLAVSPRVAFEGRGGTFVAEPQRLPFFGQGNQVELMEVENTLDVTLNTITVDLLASYRVTDFGLYVAAGPSASAVVGRHFTKEERIVSPSGVTYLDGSTEKTLFDGDMEITNSTLFGLRGGVGLDLKVARGIHINPEVLYTHPLGTISNEANNDWRASGLQATVGVLVEL